MDPRQEEFLEPEGCGSGLAKLVVGSSDCPTKAVTETLCEEPYLETFRPTWIQVARDLGANRIYIMRIQRELSLELLDMSDIVCGIMGGWVTRNKGKAALQVLIDVLLQNDMTSCADRLKMKFCN